MQPVPSRELKKPRPALLQIPEERRPASTRSAKSGTITNGVISSPEYRTVSRRPSRKIRVDFQKNRGRRARANDMTRDVQAEGVDHDQGLRDERISGKGDLSRRRTIVGAEVSGDQIVRAVDESLCRPGRVVSAIGATQCTVKLDDGRVLSCTIRRVVRTLTRDARNAVVTGDRVLVQTATDTTGVIERVEPRQGVLARGQQYRQHILVANISQVAIVASADDPPLKPALIDRFVVSAGKGGVRAVICINKADLIEPADLQPMIGLYSRLGCPAVLTSVQSGRGIAALKRLLVGQETVFTGQSGVGKSSLLNAIQPDLGLRTGEISEVTQKGRHTTRYARLIELGCGGWVVDTPGIRQLEIWDVHPAEVEGYFREFHPFVPYCRFPSCMHLYEEGCAVKRAVKDDLISMTRYESYVRIVTADT